LVHQEIRQTPRRSKMATSGGDTRLQYFGSTNRLRFILFTIALTAMLGAQDASASSNVHLLPTLKEIFGSVPKNSFPVVHAGMVLRNTDSRSKPTSESLRRGLRSKSHPFTVPVTDVNSNIGDEYYAQLQLGSPPQVCYAVPQRPLFAFTYIKL
jgi:hypothetical protein